VVGVDDLSDTESMLHSQLVALLRQELRTAAAMVIGGGVRAEVVNAYLAERIRALEAIDGHRPVGRNRT
jgi:hypothetical protein